MLETGFKPFSHLSDDSDDHIFLAVTDFHLECRSLQNQTILLQTFLFQIILYKFDIKAKSLLQSQTGACAPPAPVLHRRRCCTGAGAVPAPVLHQRATRNAQYTVYNRQCIKVMKDIAQYWEKGGKHIAQYWKSARRGIKHNAHYQDKGVKVRNHNAQYSKNHLNTLGFRVCAGQGLGFGQVRVQGLARLGFRVWAGQGLGFGQVRVQGLGRLGFRVCAGQGLGFGQVRVQGLGRLGFRAVRGEVQQVGVCSLAGQGFGQIRVCGTEFVNKVWQVRNFVRQCVVVGVQQIRVCGNDEEVGERFVQVRNCSDVQSLCQLGLVVGVQQIKVCRLN